MADRDKPKGDRPRGDRQPTGRGGSGSRGGSSGRSGYGGGGAGYSSGGRPRDDRPRSSKPGGTGGSSYRSGGGPTTRPPTDRRRKPYDAASSRPRDDRPPTDRPPKRYEGSSDRPSEYKPREYKPREYKPREYKPRTDRPYESRPRTDYPPRDDRPRQDRPYEDRPRSDRPYGNKPRRPPFDARRPYTARPTYNARPQREANSERDALVAEGEELIAGRRPVEEAFAARRDALRLLIVPERRAALDSLAIHATTLRIPVVEVEGGTLTALAGFDGHQGVALIAKARPAADVDAILARARERKEAPFVLVLDSLEDPQNFGTLLRSAEACGVHGVIYPTRRSAPLSPSAIKASAGATEHLVLAAVDDLASTLADLHGDGLRLIGADEDASLSFNDADLRGPLAIIVGSECQGISGPVRRRLDLVVRIPMRGKIQSLNAAVAGSILLLAAAGQRPSAAVQPAQESVSKGESEPQEEPVASAESVAEEGGAPADELLPGDA